MKLEFNWVIIVTKQVALCAELIFNSSVQFLHLQHQQCWLPIQGMSLSIEFAHYYSQHNRNLFLVAFFVLV